VLTSLSAGPPPVPTRPVLLAAALYAPAGIVPVLPAGAVHMGEIIGITLAYLLLVFGLSTAWFARRQDSPWTERTARFAAAAAAVGAVASLAVTILARGAGLEQAFPSTGMNFEIVECWSCEPPSDAAVRLIWYYLRFVIAATLLSPLAGAVGRSFGAHVRGAAAAR
jgi:Ca2+/H+ antiporter